MGKINGIKERIKEWVKDNPIDIVLTIISTICAIFAVVVYVRDTDLKEKIENSTYETTNFEYRKLEVANFSSSNKVVTIEGVITIDNSTAPYELVVVIQVGDNDYKKYKFYLTDNFAYYFTTAKNPTDNPYHYTIEWGK